MLNKEDTAAMMPILSAHNQNVMYLPAFAAYPDKLKKNIFFSTNEELGADRVEICKLDSLHTYAIIVGKNSLLDEYAKIYQSVYAAFNVSKAYEGLLHSAAKCSNKDGTKNKFDTSLYNNKNMISNNDTKSLEFLCRDDEVIIIYGTEDYFIKMASQESPITLRMYDSTNKELIKDLPLITGLELKDDEEHNNVTLQQNGLSDDEYTLNCSNSVLQDMADIMCMTHFPANYTESVERAKLFNFYFHVFDDKNSTDWSKSFCFYNT